MPAPDLSLNRLFTVLLETQPNLYVNGPHARVDGLPMPEELLWCLTNVAARYNRTDVVHHLSNLGKPRCLEPVSGVIEPDPDVPGEPLVMYCGTLVLEEGHPCTAHHPVSAPALGRCNNDVFGEYRLMGDPQTRHRMCPAPPAPGSTLCAWHQQVCRVTKQNGKPCARKQCRIPAHQGR